MLGPPSSRYSFNFAFTSAVIFASFLHSSDAHWGEDTQPCTASVPVQRRMNASATGFPFLISRPASAEDRRILAEASRFPLGRRECHCVPRWRGGRWRWRCGGPRPLELAED